MDPISNLSEQLQLAESIIANMAVEEATQATVNALEHDAERLAELVISLHHWKLDGGFDPQSVSTQEVGT